MKFSTTILLAASTLASAQLYPNTTMATTNTTSPLNSTFVPPPCFSISQMRAVIPPCALSCQLLALKADTCAYEDTACHCANTAKIQAVVEPCLATASNCSAAEVNAFAAIVIPTCTFFNATTNGTMPASCSKEEGHGYGYGYGYPTPVNATKPSGLPIFPKPTGLAVVVNATKNGTTWSGITPLSYEGAASTAGRSAGLVVLVGVVFGMVLI